MFYGISIANFLFSTKKPQKQIIRRRTVESLFKKFTAIETDFDITYKTIIKCVSKNW